MASPKKAEENDSSTDAIIQITDMPEKMRENTIQIVKEACSKHTNEKDIAFQVKTEMDNNYGQSWLCIVGKCYGSYVTRNVYDHTTLKAPHPARSAKLSNVGLTSVPESETVWEHAVS
ncbi:Dynein light chain 1, cytoplasmic [Trichinella nelsoni]|uniref:Dynein light chain n=1 Tax=Trichinella nelsoni TaxID=6336 RepID=A0A0V0SMI5_9BILA|nr:Dynein light chain 1, cytoplasmic [Trichinella nelsoni]